MDPVSGQSFDDWQTFYTGADRLIQYLNANSYRGAFITVACDGSSIYPSENLSPTPRHDSGVFFSNGQDPIRKDVLEMLFRMFEREGLSLVPTVALSQRLPEVERVLRQDVPDDETSVQQAGFEKGISLVGLNESQAHVGSHGRLPVYNPLNSKVQRAVTRVVEEIAGRYQQRKSFDGVALICRPDCYTLLPGRNWGYDPGTIRRFIQTQSDIASDQAGTAQGRSDLQQLLVSTHREKWLQWRAEQMTRWYEGMSDAVRLSVPNAKFYICPVDIYRNEALSSTMSPSLHSSPDFNEAMANMGLLDRLVKGVDDRGESSGVVLLNSHRMANDQTLAERRVDIEIENSTQAHNYFSQAKYPGDLFAHRASWAHFQQLELQSPFGQQRTPLTRLQVQLPEGEFNRKRFVRAIKERDSRMVVDGGWTLPFGQEETLTGIMQVFSQLPDVRFDDVTSERFGSPDSLPIAIRQYSSDSQSCFYIANASPWPMTVSLWINVGSANANFVSFSDARFEVKPTTSQVNTASAGQMRVDVRLEPFDLVGAKSDNPMSKIVDFDFELPEDASEPLRKHIYRLKSRLMDSSNRQAMNVIENSSFEINGQPTLLAWDTGEQATKTCDWNRRAAFQTKASKRREASLFLSGNENQPIWVRSNVFESPSTGRLSISVWLKTNDPEKPASAQAISGRSIDRGQLLSVWLGRKLVTECRDKSIGPKLETVCRPFRRPSWRSH